MRKLCIIPARGGSKRIPDKNKKLFLGKPIISYSIEASIASNCFDEIMVSTDSVDIANLSKEHGAKVPFVRSDKNSDDQATTFDVIQEVLESYNENSQSFDVVCCIYPCAPFVTPATIQKAYNKLITEELDSVFPVMEYSTPIQRALKVEEGRVKFFQEFFEAARSQDLPTAYFDAGQFYWMRIDQILAKKKIVTDNSGSIHINEMEGQDIDNESDWLLAEMKYKIANDIS